MEGCLTKIDCADGVTLTGHWWGNAHAPLGVVVINAATGVKAQYYHRYAAFLAERGFKVLTYDYRGIGLSRPGSLVGSRFTWSQWGELDFDAALAQALKEDGRPLVVGHSIGGFLPGYAENARHIGRMLTVGAQYAYWPDYRSTERLGYFLRWHVAMPLLTAAFGYFPGRRLGWLEDLPPGVANEWSFRGRRIETRLIASRREEVLARFAAVSAPLLALTVSDDPFATKPAVTRALDYYTGATRSKVMLDPADLGLEKVGHFDLFHSRHASGFWVDTLLWLREGVNPWPGRVFA